MFNIYKDLTNKGTEYTVYDDEGTRTYLAGDPELEEIAVAKLGKDWKSKVLVTDFRERYEDGFGSFINSKENYETMQEAHISLFGGISGGTGFPTVELNGRIITETTPEEKSDINKIGKTVKEAFETFAKKYNCKDVTIDMTVNYKKDSIDESKKEIKKLAIECVKFGMHSEAVKLLEKIK